MYIKEDLPVNNTQHVSPKIYWGFVHHSHPIREGQRRAPPPLQRGGGHIWGSRWSLGHQSTSIIQLNTRKKSKHIRLHFLSLNFCGLFFVRVLSDFVQTKRLVHLHKHTLVFFFLIYIYNPLWFTFTVCATTSHRRRVGC